MKLPALLLGLTLTTLIHATTLDPDGEYCDELDDIPTCAIPCIHSAATTISCSPTDYTCVCLRGNSPGTDALFLNAVKPCVISNCPLLVAAGVQKKMREVCRGCVWGHPEGERMERMERMGRVGRGGDGDGEKDARGEEGYGKDGGEGEEVAEARGEKEGEKEEVKEEVNEGEKEGQEQAERDEKEKKKEKQDTAAPTSTQEPGKGRGKAKLQRMQRLERVGRREL